MVFCYWHGLVDISCFKFSFPSRRLTNLFEKHVSDIHCINKLKSFASYNIRKLWYVFSCLLLFARVHKQCVCILKGMAQKSNNTHDEAPQLSIAMVDHDYFDMEISQESESEALDQNNNTARPFVEMYPSYGRMLDRARGRGGRGRGSSRGGRAKKHGPSSPRTHRRPVKRALLSSKSSAGISCTGTFFIFFYLY